MEEEKKRPGGEMAPWSVKDLPEPRPFTFRNVLAVVGPGAIALSVSIGTGEWILGPGVVVDYGATLMWIVTLSVLFQLVLNLHFIRYTVYTGEPVVNGFMRTRPGPVFWAVVYIALALCQLGWPAWAASSAAPLFTYFSGHLPSEEVTFEATSSDPDKVKVEPSYITFSGKTALTPKTLTVSPADGVASLEGVKFTIVLDSARSGDPNYHGIDPVDIIVVGSERGPPTLKLAGAAPSADGVGITVAPVSIFSVGLDVADGGKLIKDEDVTIALKSSNPEAVTFRPSTLIFNSKNGRKIQSVFVQSVSLAEGANATIVLEPIESKDARFQGIDPVDVQVTGRGGATPPVLSVDTADTPTGKSGVRMKVVEGDTFMVVLNTVPEVGKRTSNIMLFLGILNFLIAVIIVAFGGKVERMLEIVNWIMVTFIFGFLIVACIWIVPWSVWWDVFAGHFKFFTFPEQEVDWIKLGVQA